MANFISKPPVDRLLEQIYSGNPVVFPNAYLVNAKMGNFNLKYANLMGSYLTNADLAGADLTGADLRDAYLIDTNLTGAYLTNAIFRGADLTDAIFTGADLRGANFTRADLRGANLTGADLTDAIFEGADLADAIFTGADLTGTDLRGANLTGADLTDAILTRTDFTGADLTGANLMDANFSETIFEGADLTGAFLTGNNLTGINFTGANLADAELEGAILIRANLTYANLSGANLADADLSNSILTGAHNMADAILTGAILTGIINEPHVDPRQVHKAASKINYKKINELLNKKSQTIKSDINYPEFIRDKITDFILKIDDHAEINILTSGLNSIMEQRLDGLDYSSFPQDVRESIFHVLNYVSDQSTEFQKMYVETFVKDCVHAYEGADGMTCAAGAIERILFSLLPACASSPNSDCETIIDIIEANFEKLVVTYIKDWYVLHKGATFEPGTDRRTNLIDFLKEKLTGEDIEWIESKVDEIAGNIGYDDGDFDFKGGKTKKRRAKKQLIKKIGVKTKRRPRSKGGRRTRRH